MIIKGLLNRNRKALHSPGSEFKMAWETL